MDFSKKKLGPLDCDHEVGVSLTIDKDQLTRFELHYDQTARNHCFDAKIEASIVKGHISNASG